MKQSNVIDGKTTEHSIEAYHFKVLSKETLSVEQNTICDEKEPSREDIKDNDKNESKFESGFIEELLKKTDELSGNIIKLQMQIENQENEFKIKLEEETLKAKEEGILEATATVKREQEKEIEEIKSKYISSIQKLDEERDKLAKLYISTKSELAATAIDIAKKIVLKEIKENSSIIAFNIAKTLINELEGSSKIEIKTNPADFEYIKANLDQKSNIKITSDDAISSGGVIVLSDIGNIDGSPKARFTNMKNILSE